jgi:hypothetical protein
MLVNICSYGTAFSVTVEPGLAAWKPSMVFLKPASSLSVPQVVKVSVPAVSLAAGVGS